MRAYMDANDGLTEQTVLDRLDTFGRPMSRAKLGRIKAGQTSVSVDDLFGLAYAVGAAPVSLLVDLTDDQPVEVVGGESMHPVVLCSWISGLGADTPTRSYPFDGPLRAWQRRYWAWREFDELVGWQAGTSGREKVYRDGPPTDEALTDETDEAQADRREWFRGSLQRWNGPPPVGTRWNNAKGETKREAYGSARRLVSACFEARVQRLQALPMARATFVTLVHYMGWDDEWKDDPDGWADDLGIEVINPAQQEGNDDE